MNDASLVEFNPAMDAANRTVFIHFRLAMMSGLFLAIAAVALFVR